MKTVAVLLISLVVLSACSATNPADGLPPFLEQDPSQTAEEEMAACLAGVRESDPAMKVFLAKKMNVRPGTMEQVWCRRIINGRRSGRITRHDLTMLFRGVVTRRMDEVMFRGR